MVLIWQHFFIGLNWKVGTTFATFVSSSQRVTCRDSSGSWQGMAQGVSSNGLLEVVLDSDHCKWSNMIQYDPIWSNRTHQGRKNNRFTYVHLVDPGYFSDMERWHQNSSGSRFDMIWYDLMNTASNLLPAPWHLCSHGTRCAFPARSLVITLAGLSSVRRVWLKQHLRIKGWSFFDSVPFVILYYMGMYMEKE